MYAADALIDLAPAPPLPDKNDLDAPGGPGNSGPPPPGHGGGGGGGGFQYPPQQQQQQPPYYQHMGAYGYPPAGNMAYPAGGAMAYPPPPSSMPPPGQNGSMYPNEKSMLNFEEGPPPYFPPDMGSQSAANAPRYELSLEILLLVTKTK